MTDTIMNKQTTRIPTTEPSTPASTTTVSTSRSPLKMSNDYIRRPSVEFLLYIKQVEERKMKEKIEQLLSRPNINDIQEEDIDQEVFLAIMIATLICLCVIICSVAIFVYQRSFKSRTTQPDTDAESTTSTYLQYSTQGSECGYIANYDITKNDTKCIFISLQWKAELCSIFNKNLLY